MPTAANKRKHGAPLVDSAQLKLRKEIVVLAPLFLAQLGIAAPAATNESFVAASAASSLSAKNNGVLTLNV
ncbi:MAG TPA: hypothetical protein VNI77_01745, partial [Nitrososphaera sp.]|nr:hypothetical protein [Nitrososphaera sp.]